jgi:membrane-associated protein
VISSLNPALVLPAIGPEWLDPQNLDRFGTAALWIAIGIVFAETGLLIGFFLPGDSLLFMVGLFVATGIISVPLGVACALLTAAAMAGSFVGYWIGMRVGPPLFSRADSRLFKREYVEKTERFFQNHGPRAIILARFVPIVRTFITAMAGVGRMDRRTYFAYSAVGAVLWATGVTMLGYFLGNVKFVNENIELLLIGIVALSVIPIAIEGLRQRAAGNRSNGQ